MKIALAMIVKPSNEEAEVLERCLSNIRPFVDAIYITITGKNTQVEKVAKRYKAVISYFDWINDFAKARNYNFSQVPKEYDYILWCDADDVFRGLDKLKPTLEKNKADCYSLFYLYAFDEFKQPIVVHQKTQVIKNDGCLSWEGALHEDFRPNREVTRHFIKGIERLHLTDEVRIEQAKERNLQVALNQQQTNPDDPRSLWNVGNSLKALGRNEEAIDTFNQFLKSSQSDDEKYIVRLRRAESYWQLGRKDEAIDECRYAIGLKPDFPDAYHLLGSLYFETNQLEKAKASYLQGLLKKPPYHSIIVFNPRDYDYTPMMNLAKVYFRLSLPQMALTLLKGCAKIYPEDSNLKHTISLMTKEAKKAEEVVKIVAELKELTDKQQLKERLDKIPKKYQSHPAVCNLRNLNFIKETSSGKDLVIFCGFTQEIWTPETAKTKGIGGSEEAVINLSKQFAKLGWQVTVYNNCGHKEQKFGQVTYKPFWSWNTRDKQDVVILWRTPRMLDYEINCPKIIVDLHDVIQEGEFTEPRLRKIHKIFVKSQFHRSLFPNIADEKFVVVPNGINAQEFEQQLERDRYLLINTSSPDRSLAALVKLFPEIKKQVPEARCKWAYGWSVFDTVHSADAKMMAWKDDLIKRMAEAGIENLGRLSHPEVNKLYMQAGVFAYPSEFAEIDCISLSKALAGGATPITTDFAAMGDKQQEGGEYIHSAKTKDNWCPAYKFDFSLEDDQAQASWVKAVVKQLKTPKTYPDMRDNARKKYNWQSIAQQWHKHL